MSAETAPAPTNEFAAPGHEGTSDIPSTFGASSGLGGTAGGVGSGLGHTEHTTTAAAAETHAPKTGGHDPYAEQAKKEAFIGKVEVAIGKAIHSESLVAKGEAHLEHAHVVGEKGIKAPDAHPTTTEVQHQREELAEAPSLAGGVESFGPDGVPNPVVAGPGGQSGVLLPGNDHTRFGQY